VKPPVEELIKEPEVPKRDKKDMWLSDLEYEIRNKLRDGKCLTNDDIDDIIRFMVQSPLAQTKGFIIDVNFTSNMESE
jgi:hypothetical protein